MEFKINLTEKQATVLTESALDVSAINKRTVTPEMLIREIVINHIIQVKQSKVADELRVGQEAAVAELRS